MNSVSTGRFDWARYRSRGELLDQVLEIEHRVRNTVRTGLMAASPGDDWQRLIPDSVRTEIARRSKRPSGDVLDGATLAQLIGLIQHHWSQFEQLNVSRSSFDVIANEFREW